MGASPYIEGVPTFRSFFCSLMSYWPFPMPRNRFPDFDFWKAIFAATSGESCLGIDAEERVSSRSLGRAEV